MKAFDELTQTQKQQAIAYHERQLLIWLAEGQPVIPPDNPLIDNLDKAVEKAEQNRTPWFIHEFILEDDELVRFIKDEATAMASEIEYIEPGDPPVVYLADIEKMKVDNMEAQKCIA